MILATFFRQVQGLRDRTELLEALNWDEALTDRFVNELQVMLMAAPPNLEKAMFWLKNTPWECFDNLLMPENVFQVIEILMSRTAAKIISEEEARNRHGALVMTDVGEDDDEWN